MLFLRKQFADSPILARVAPFVIFLLITFCQGRFFDGSEYWLYLAKTLVGAWLIWEMRDAVTEMQLCLSWQALVVGLGVFVMWIGIDPLYPKLGELLAKVGLAKATGVEPVLWNPNVEFGQGSAVAWFFMIMRILGMALVVPPLEEVFFRSFLYRYIAKPNFQSMPLGQFAWPPFLITSVIFGLEHHQWLAGILCGFAYQCLVIWKKRLDDAIVAHGVTNFLLGVWVVWKGDWKFW